MATSNIFSMSHDIDGKMRITKGQLRRIIWEETVKSTKKYDDDSALKGDQDELPDALQKGIIDKSVEDREEDEEENGEWRFPSLLRALGDEVNT